MSRETTSRRRPPKALIALLALLVLGGAGFCWWWDHRDTTSSKLASGSVEATQYQVASVLTGRVTGVAVAEGATVKAGQKLVTLDDRALQLQLQQADDGVAAAQAAVDQTKDGTSAEQAEAKARLAQAKASVDLAKVQLGYATITAPHAGTVVTVTTSVGANAAPGAALLTIQDTSDLYARVYVPENELGAATIGAAAEVAADGVPKSKGTVTFVASDAEFTPNTVQTRDQRVKLVYEVRVRVNDPSTALKAGMPVDVALG